MFVFLNQKFCLRIFQLSNARSLIDLNDFLFIIFKNALLSFIFHDLLIDFKNQSLLLLNSHYALISIL